jgi:DinB superfamily
VLTSVPESAAGVKLKDEGWSILQVAEHVAAVEHRMLRAIQSAATKTSPPDVERDSKIAVAVRSRERKLQAPEMVVPKGRWLTIAESAEAFKQGRANTVEFARTAENLRGRSFMHPLLGEIDGYQALLVMAHHPERHSEQINEIKNSAAYAASTK